MCKRVAQPTGREPLISKMEFPMHCLNLGIRPWGWETGAWGALGNRPAWLGMEKADKQELTVTSAWLGRARPLICFHTCILVTNGPHLCGEVVQER